MGKAKERDGWNEAELRVNGYYFLPLVSVNPELLAGIFPYIVYSPHMLSLRKVCSVDFTHSEVQKLQV